jgi:hypothetical protein
MKSFRIPRGNVCDQSTTNGEAEAGAEITGLPR